MKLKKAKNHNVKTWKKELMNIQSNDGTITSNIAREYTALEVETYMGVKQYDRAWEKGMGLHYDKDYEEESTELKIRHEFDLDNAQIRHCQPTQESLDWREEWMVEFKERKAAEGYTCTQKDELSIVKCKEIESWDKQLRSILMGETLLKLIADNPTEASKAFAAFIRVVDKNGKGFHNAIAPSQQAMTSVRGFATAYLAVLECDNRLLSLDEAAMIKEYLVPNSYLGGKPPLHIKVWHSQAVENVNFAKKLSIALSSLKSDTGDDGQEIHEAMTTSVSEWKTEKAWRWMGKVREWQATFKKGSLATFDKKSSPIGLLSKRIF